MAARILLVEDAAETRNFLADSILTPEGYEVIKAASAHEALAHIHQQQPALIISDYLMPGLTGLDLLRELKHEGLNIPFILVTAEGSELLAVQAMRLGVRDYLIKPFDIGDLLDAIERVLRDASPTETYADSPQQLISFLSQISHTIILFLDKEKRLLFYNDAAVRHLNFPAPPLLGMPLQEVIVSRDLLSLLDEVNGSITRQEVNLIDNRYFNVEITPIPQQGTAIIMQEISHLKELDRIKSEFITTISHDLRSPLTTILGYLDLLERVGSLNEQQQTYKDHIAFNVQSINALLVDLLDLSKIEAGVDMGFEPIQMSLVLRYAIEAQRIDLERKGHQLVTQIAPDLPLIHGNPIRLKQVVNNLLQNAIKYTPTRGQIEIRLYENEGFLLLQITDNGIGIPLDEQPHIWDKFYRTDAAMSSYPGTGLGLSIVKGIVDSHGGRIWVESTPDVGSTFIVMLAGIYDTNTHS